MKAGGISLNIGKGKTQLRKVALGKPRPQIDGLDCWFGFRFDLVWGPLVMPVRKWYLPRAWGGDQRYNPWNSGNHWFVVKLPIFLGFFVSVLLGKALGSKVPGFWFGCRTANLSNTVDWQLRLDWEKSEYDPAAWAVDSQGNPIEAWPVGQYKGRPTVELTLAIRSDMRH